MTSTALDRFLGRPDPLRFSSYGLARSAAELLREDGATTTVEHVPRERADPYPFLVTTRTREASAA